MNQQSSSPLGALRLIKIQTNTTCRCGTPWVDISTWITLNLDFALLATAIASSIHTDIIAPTLYYYGPSGILLVLSMGLSGPIILFEKCIMVCAGSRRQFLRCLDEIADKRDVVSAAKCLTEAKENYETVKERKLAYSKGRRRYVHIYHPLIFSVNAILFAFRICI